MDFSIEQFNLCKTGGRRLMKWWMKVILWLFAATLAIFLATLVITAAVVIKRFLM